MGIVIPQSYVFLTVATRPLIAPREQKEEKQNTRETLITQMIPPVPETTPKTTISGDSLHARLPSGRHRRLESRGAGFSQWDENVTIFCNEMAAGSATSHARLCCHGACSHIELPEPDAKSQILVL